MRKIWYSTFICILGSGLPSTGYSITYTYSEGRVIQVLIALHRKRKIIALTLTSEEGDIFTEK